MSKISVVIPTYNAGSLLYDVLEQIFKQDHRPYEVIVIDSSSVDGTDVLAQKFPVRFFSIDKTDFGHGKTRNYGASLAQGEYVVFVTQDAVPRDASWLGNLVTGFNTKKVAGSFSRQIAREDAVPMEKFFYSKMYSDRTRRFTKNDMFSQDILFSNASSAVRRSFILSNPFAEDILMSEDYEWALRMLNEGYNIVYQADSRVTHSHNTSFSMLFKRYFDFGVSHAEIRHKQQASSYFGKGLVTVLQEIKYLVVNGSILWVPRSLSYNAAKFFGLLLGRSHRVLPRTLKRQFTSYYKEYWA